jgi:NTP pyrophosphatase (non-canonical NTP hydrolase)
MTFKEYQKKANSTAIYKYKIIYPCIGLAGETGEVCEKIKKVLRDNDSIFDDKRKEEIKKELGDVLWYVSAIATDLGLNLDEIAEDNIEKLFKRKKDNKIQGSGDNR